MPGYRYTKPFDLLFDKCKHNTLYCHSYIYDYCASIKNKEKTKLRQEYKVLDSTSLEAECKNNI